LTLTFDLEGANSWAKFHQLPT